MNFGTGRPGQFPQRLRRTGRFVMRWKSPAPSRASRKSLVLGCGRLRSRPVDSKKLVPMSQRQAVPAACTCDHRLEEEASHGMARQSYSDPWTARCCRRHRHWVKEEIPRGHRAARQLGIFPQPRSSDTGRCAGWQGCVCPSGKANAELAIPEVDQRLVPVSQRQQPSETPRRHPRQPRRVVGRNLTDRLRRRTFKFPRNTKDAPASRIAGRCAGKGFGLIGRRPADCRSEQNCASAAPQPRSEQGKPRSPPTHSSSAGWFESSAMADLPGSTKEMSHRQQFLVCQQEQGQVGPCTSGNRRICYIRPIYRRRGLQNDCGKMPSSAAQPFTPLRARRNQAHSEAEAQNRFDDHLGRAGSRALADDFDHFNPQKDLGYEMDDAKSSAGYDEANGPIKLEVRCTSGAGQATGIDRNPA